MSRTIVAEQPNQTIQNEQAVASLSKDGWLGYGSAEPKNCKAVETSDDPQKS